MLATPMEKSLKTRINKFIFQNENIYFRIQSKAKNLKVKKFQSNYLMEFENTLKKNLNTSRFISVDVLMINDLKLIPSDHKNEANFEVVHKNTTSFEDIQETWGLRRCVFNEVEKSKTYYLLPNKISENISIGIQIGPILNSVNDEVLVLDWANIQWGTVQS